LRSRAAHRSCRGCSLRDAWLTFCIWWHSIVNPWTPQNDLRNFGQQGIYTVYLHNMERHWRLRVLSNDVDWGDSTWWEWWMPVTLDTFFLGFHLTEFIQNLAWWNKFKFDHICLNELCLKPLILAYCIVSSFW
jgi:hypothetical protein